MRDVEADNREEQQQRGTERREEGGRGRWLKRRRERRRLREDDNDRYTWRDHPPDRPESSILVDILCYRRIESLTLGVRAQLNDAHLCMAQLLQGAKRG